MAKSSSKLSLFAKIFIITIFIVFCIGVGFLVNTLKKVYSPNVEITGQTNAYIYIRTGSDLSEVCKSLYENSYIVNRESFEWLAKRMKYAEHIKAGRYKLSEGMSNKDLIELLRSGKQEPMRFSINNIRLKSQLAGLAGRNLELDSTQLLHLLNDDNFVSNYGFNRNTIISIFIPNTYEIFWNTDAESFVKRMKKEYDKFWNNERLEKAKKIGYSPVEIITIASIVDEESNVSAEFPTVAGVYINRLKRDMPLQADPTVKFAMGNFMLKRIFSKFLDFDSPYNTYKYKGLPPGPICIPSIKAINSVLNYERHNYLYFCAKSDFSGAHVFAKTLSQHNANAAAYQKALNKKKIF